MAVIVSHAQIQAVKDALAKVQSNGQALAAVDAAKKAAKDLRSHLTSVGGNFRLSAAKDLETYSARLDPIRKALNGASTSPVGQTWSAPKGGKEQVMNLYMLAFTLESTMPPGQDFGDGWGPALSYAVAELPATITAAVAVAAKVATQVVGGVAKIGGGIVWGFVKGAWPLLLVAAVVVGGFVFVKGKLVKAVLP